jgi:ElaB/YqjD/DUF883 family membrane-anchored ribosome-binding protein
METAINERARDAATAVRDASVSACRQAAAMPRQALCEDTSESLTYLADRATRTVRRGLQSVEDVGSDTARCIKRHPFTAVGFTLAVGVTIGAVIGGFETKRRLNALLRED